jgi:glycosyltransferase involved in cell wall biosynthesis
MNLKGEKKPSVCFVYYQGFTELLYREALALKNEGFEVDIICLKSIAREHTVELYEGMRIFRIQGRMGAESSTLRYLHQLNLFFVKAFLFLSYLSIRRRYDLIHFTSPPDVAIFITMISKIQGAKVILDIHDIGPELFMRKVGVGEGHMLITLIKMLERLSSRFADHVITVTDLWRDVLVSRSIPAEKCSVLLNVPDHNLFRVVPRQEAVEEKFDLYYHGSIEEHFGVDTLLAAMPLIKNAIPHVQLHIYAMKKGRLMPALIRQIKHFRMTQYVTFHDAVPFYELPDVLKGADVGIVPTKNHTFSNEAVSSKSLEYIFSGIPIVISRTAGHSFYYDDSMVTFFDPCNSNDLAAAVIDLYQNKARRKEQLQRCREFIQNNSWENAKLDYVRIVNGLVRKEGSQAALSGN